MKLTVTIEIEAELELSDDVDWEARAAEEFGTTRDQMIGSIAMNVCVDGRTCPQLDGLADLPEDAAIGRGWDIADTTVIEQP